MRPMKLLLAGVGAVVLAVGCNMATVGGSEEEDSEALYMESEVSALGEAEENGGECPPPECSETCGRNGEKVRICHHAPPDTPGSKTIELCIAAPGAEAHLREHDEDTRGCCPKK